MPLTLTATRPDANHIYFTWTHYLWAFSFLFRSIDNLTNWMPVDGEGDTYKIAKCYHEQDSRLWTDYYPYCTQYWRVAVIFQNPGQNPIITFSSYVKVDPYVTQDYYAVRRCGDLNEDYYIGPFPDGTYSSGRRITPDYGTTFYIITGSQHQPYADRSLLINSQDTGQYGCP